MSYARFSPTSDVYAYESEEGFVVYVAKTRPINVEEVFGVYEHPIKHVVKKDSQDLLEFMRDFNEKSSRLQYDVIGLSCDGKSFLLETEEDMLECLKGLHEYGYRVPEHLLED